MLLNNRIIYKDNTVLNDFSISLSDYRSSSETITLIAAEDALYIGSDLPFNHRYFELGATVNALASLITVRVWNGNSFVPAVDVLDQTLVGGKTLARSGIISWVPDKNEVWVKEETTESISDLNTLKIYNMYWAKFTFSADLTTALTLSFIGHKFSRDDDLETFYPELTKSAMLTAFQAGKTNWDEQHVAAAEQIVSDLRKRRKIWSANQILNWETFTTAACHKVAEYAFVAFGDDYENNRIQANANYRNEVDAITYDLDRNYDAKLQPSEKRISAGIFRS